MPRKTKNPQVVAAPIPEMTITGEPPQAGGIMQTEDGEYIRLDGVGNPIGSIPQPAVGVIEDTEVLEYEAKASNAKEAFKTGAYEDFVASIVEETLDKYYGCTSTKDAPPLLNALLKWFREYRELTGGEVAEDDPVLAMQQQIAAKRG